MKIGVVGLGAVGSGAFWSLASRGAEVTGFEQFDIGHDRGSSHGFSRLFMSVSARSPQESALAQRAFELWRRLEQESGEHVLQMTGGLAIGREGSEIIRSMEKLGRETDIQLDCFDPAELRRRYPQHRIEDDEVGILDHSSGYLRPEAAIMAECRLAVAHGATIVKSAVTQVIPNDNSVTLVTAEGAHEFDSVVMAAGAWQGQLLPFLPLKLVPRRAMLSWFTPKPGKESLFTKEAFPTFSHEAFGEFGWGAPAFDELGVKVGLNIQDGYEIEDPMLNRKIVEAEELERVSAFVAQALPDLNPVPAHSAGCMITLTPDEEYAIGIPQEHSRLVVLSACSGHGFKASIAVGEVGADLALTGVTEKDISQFSLSRFGM